MARDISKIKSQALLREQSGTPISKPFVRETKTISSLRSDELRDDRDTRELMDKSKTVKMLSILVKKKRSELETLSETIKSTIDTANSESDRIVRETKQKASELILQARSDLESTQKMLRENEELKRFLDNEKSNLEVTKRTLEDKFEELEKATEVINKRVKDVEKLEEVATKNKEASVEIFVNVLALFNLVFEQTSLLEKLNSEASTNISQTLQKAVKMVERTAVIIKNVDDDKFILKKKAQELQEWQDGLIDREQTLDRAAKELNQK